MMKVVHEARPDLIDLQFTGVDDAETTRVTQNLARDWFYIQIGGTEIRAENTSFLEIRDDAWLPHIRLTFKDPEGLYSGPAAITHGDLVSLWLNAPEPWKPVRADFKITEFKTQSSGTGRSVWIFARLWIPQAETPRIQTWRDQTWWQTARALTQDVGLGMVSNITDTQDRGTWILPRQTPLKWLKTWPGAWPGPDGWLTGWIDLYYRFNLFEGESGTPRADDWETSRTETGGVTLLDGENRPVKTVLADTNTLGVSELEITHSEIKNRASVNDRLGYTLHWERWNGTATERTEIEPLMGEPSDQTIPQRGKPGQTDWQDQSLVVHSLPHANRDIHFNYSEIAEQWNQLNAAEYFKRTLVVDLAAINYSLYRGQAILVIIFRDKPVPDARINVYKSGWWVITGIIWQRRGRGQPVQRLKLNRKREMLPDFKKI